MLSGYRCVRQDLQAGGGQARNKQRGTHATEHSSRVEDFYPTETPYVNNDVVEEPAGHMLYQFITGSSSSNAWSSNTSAREAGAGS